AILCRKCGFALKPGSDRVSRHLGENHNVAKSARRGLNSLIRSLDLPEPNTLTLRPDGSSPHLYLETQKGSACKHCGLRSTSEKVLAAHLKTCHHHKIRLAAGQQKHHWLRDHIKEGLAFQSWTAKCERPLVMACCHNKQLGQGFVHNSLLLQAGPDPIKHFAQKLFAEERERLEGQKGAPRLYDTGVPASSDLLTNWMRRTGWQTTFANARLDILISLAELPLRTPDRPLRLGHLSGEILYSPAGDERRLALMMKALDRLLDRCGETVKGTDVCLRRWLRSRFPDRPYKAPFELVAKKSSECLYRKELKRCLCFWLRLLQLSPSIAREILGRGLSGSQRRVLMQLWSDCIWEAEGLTTPQYRSSLRRRRE
ncbi:hypothetical protein EDB80DRAFT_595002, partial [Ilyonectria destructans]